MHMRGKSAWIEAVIPDASVHRILTIPKCDFNWQLNDEPKEPLRIPAQMVVDMRAPSAIHLRTRQIPIPIATFAGAE